MAEAVAKKDKNVLYFIIYCIIAAMAGLFRRLTLSLPKGCICWVYLLQPFLVGLSHLKYGLAF